MRNRFVAAGLAVLACLGASALPARPARFKAKNVVILVIDGPRQSEMWEDPARTYIPHLSQELAPQGTLLSGFRDNGPTYTDAGHTALCTGWYQDIDNSGQQLPDHAGIFQYFLRASGLPKERAWVITSKDKLTILSDTQDPGWKGLFRPSTYCGRGGQGPGAGYGEDSDTLAAAETILGREHPRLVLINFKQPDAGGHSGRWSAYIEGLRASDGYAAELWTFLQADSFYKNRTACFITHDHGRHLDGVKDGFVSHGDDCEGCRRIALLALGPDFKRGAVIPSGGEQVDLPVTIAALLGFDLPGTKGRVLKELFK